MINRTHMLLVTGAEFNAVLSLAAKNPHEPLVGLLSELLGEPLWEACIDGIDPGERYLVPLTDGHLYAITEAHSGYGRGDIRHYIPWELAERLARLLQALKPL